MDDLFTPHGETTLAHVHRVQGMDTTDIVNQRDKGLGTDAGASVNRSDVGNLAGNSTADDCLDWRSPALSLALERVFDFFLAPDIEQRPVVHASLVARVEMMRWLAAQARGPLRGSPEFRTLVRRAARSVPLCCARFGDLYVHRWPGLAGLDRSPADDNGHGSVTLVVGLPCSGKSYAAIRLCASMVQAMRRASGWANAPYSFFEHMTVQRLSDGPVDADIDYHLSQNPYARVAVMEPGTRNYDKTAETLRERRFHVMAYEYPPMRAFAPHCAIDRVLVALGPHGSFCRNRSLSEHVAALVDADPAALNALFAVAPDYTYVWFEPVSGRFGPGRTVISLSRASDFETAGGTAPPLDPQHFFPTMSPVALACE